MKWSSAYPIHEVTQVSLRTNEARVRFEDSEGAKVLVLHGFDVASAGHQFLSECYQIRLIDLNIRENNSVEYGRWRVEIWDEDNVIFGFSADRYEVSSEVAGE